MMYKLFVFVLFTAVGIAAGQTDQGTDHGTDQGTDHGTGHGTTTGTTTGTATETPEMQFQTLCGTVTTHSEKLSLLGSKVTC